MSKTKVTPLGDRVLVRQDEEPTMSTGGIYLPDTAKETPQKGTVVCVGEGKLLENGQVRRPAVKTGDKVIYGKYSGTKIKVDAEELLFIREDDIMAVVEA
jgi:chaperonin GroES